jgi:hypothetical protein
MRSVKCKRCAQINNGWCDKIQDSPDIEDERDCQYFRQMTKGEFVRRLSDDALAYWIACPERRDMEWLASITVRSENGCFGLSCIECKKMWVKQPCDSPYAVWRAE